jgi:hypothetical protein
MNPDKNGFELGPEQVVEASLTKMLAALPPSLRPRDIHYLSFWLGHIVGFPGYQSAAPNRSPAEHKVSVATFVKRISDDCRNLGDVLHHEADKLAILGSLPNGFVPANDRKAVVWLERLAAEMHWMAESPRFRTPLLANGGQGGRPRQDYYVRRIAVAICAYTMKIECRAAEDKSSSFPQAKAQEWLRAVLEDLGLKASNSLETLIRQSVAELVGKDMATFSMWDLIPDSLPPATDKAD